MDGRSTRLKQLERRSGKSAQFSRTFRKQTITALRIIGTRGSWNRTGGWFCRRRPYRSRPADLSSELNSSGGQCFGLPCSSTTSDSVPGGRICNDFKNSIRSFFSSAVSLSNACRRNDCQRRTCRARSHRRGIGLGGELATYLPSALWQITRQFSGESNLLPSFPVIEELQHA
jgi:hypothetical protein